VHGDVYPQGVALQMAKQRRQIAEIDRSAIENEQREQQEDAEARRQFIEELRRHPERYQGDSQYFTPEQMLDHARDQC
jgi:hypothetical protein